MQELTPFSVAEGLLQCSLFLSAWQSKSFKAGGFKCQEIISIIGWITIFLSDEQESSAFCFWNGTQAGNDLTHMNPGYVHLVGQGRQVECRMLGDEVAEILFVHRRNKCNFDQKFIVRIAGNRSSLIK